MARKKDLLDQSLTRRDLLKAGAIGTVGIAAAGSVLALPGLGQSPEDAAQGQATHHVTEGRARLALRPAVGLLGQGLIQEDRGAALDEIDAHDESLSGHGPLDETAEAFVEAVQRWPATGVPATGAQRGASKPVARTGRATDLRRMSTARRKAFSDVIDTVTSRSNVFEDPAACRTAGTIVNRCVAAGDAFDQQVTVREQADHHPMNQPLLPHDVVEAARPHRVTYRRLTPEQHLAFGRRFGELQVHDFVEGMFRANASEPSVPAWLICDRAFIRDYGLGLVHPGAGRRQIEKRRGFARTRRRGLARRRRTGRGRPAAA